MPQVKVGPKYQVVIPKAVRRRIGIRPGSYVLIDARQGRQAVIRASAVAYLDRYQGSLTGAWDQLGGSTRYLKRERDDWDK